MNHRQRATLAEIFARPTRATVRWSDVESLLRALGADITHGGGSMVALTLNEIRAVVHRPHPRPTCKKYLVRNLRDFLTTAGVTPDPDDE